MNGRRKEQSDHDLTNLLEKDRGVESVEKEYMQQGQATLQYLGGHYPPFELNLQRGLLRQLRRDHQVRSTESLLRPSFSLHFYLYLLHEK
jgi:hypothetical protein